MHFSTVATIALAAGASAHYNGSVSYTTEIVDEYTTYCPYATHLTHAGVVYTVTEATTITITNCPCTVTKPVPVYTSSVSVSIPTPVAVSTSAVVVPPPVVVSSVSAPKITTPPPAPKVSTAVVVPPPVSSVVVIPPPVSSVVVVPPPVFANSTSVAPPSTGTGSPVVSATPSTLAFKGAGNQVAVSGAGLAAVLGLAALLL